MARLHSILIHNKRRGTTLLEMMFTVAGLTLVTAAVLGVYIAGVHRYNEDSDRNRSNSALMLASENLKRDIRNANEVKLFYGSYVTDSDTIVLSAPSYDENGVMPNSFDYIIYEINSDGALVRTIIPAAGSSRESETARVMVQAVATLSLTYIVHDFFDGDGVTSTYNLTTSWLNIPICRVDGTPQSASYYSYNNSASLGAVPASGSVVEFEYLISPGNPTGVAAVSEIVFTVQSDTGNESAAVDGSARLRNAR